MTGEAKQNTACPHSLQYSIAYWVQKGVAYFQIQFPTVAYVRSCNGFFLFSIFTFFQKNLETNDTSFESPKIELLESCEKLGVAKSWSWPRPPNQKSTSFSRICLEPFMIEICLVSNLLSNSGL